MAQGTLTARVSLVDPNGDLIGTEDVTLAVDSEPLRVAVLALTEAVHELRDVLLLTNS